MLKNYIKIAFRNISKQKGYAFINTVGLAIGMGICLFLFLLMQYAFTYDRYHENSDRIYRVADKITQQNGSILDVAISASPWGQAMVDDFPEVEDAVRFMGRGAAIQYENKILRQGITYVDEGIFDVFSYDFKYGNPEGALANPSSIVLTEQMSVRYFGEENPIGRTLLLDKEPFEVTGVLQKLNPRSSFMFNSLVPFSSVTEEDYASLNDWRSHNLYTYLLLQEGTDIAALEAKFPAFVNRHIGEEFVQRYDIHLQPLTDLFLHSNLYAEHGDSLEIAYIYIFMALGLLILIIACINFVNLSTAQGLKRSKEVGVRKVMGAFKGQLVFQFLAEAVILSIFGVLISLVLVEVALPWFNDIAEWSVEATYLSNPLYLIAIFLVVVLVGVLAGGYPAFVLSAFKPAAVLKGEKTGTGGKSFLRTALVVTQFTVAIFMIVSTLAVDRQLSYLKNKDLGFDKNNILVVGVPDALSENGHNLVREELFKIPGVSNVSFSSNTPGNESGNRVQFYPEGTFSEDGTLVNTYSIDEYFISQFNLELLQGRDFSSDIESGSSNSLIINEAAASRFGWDDPVGKTITRRIDGEEILYTVVGVVKDFNYETLHSRIAPLIIRYDPESFFDITVKVSSADFDGVATQISDALKAFNSGVPVWYYYLEEDIATDYTTEEVIGEMLRYFAYLTIFIACLGLLGLVSFSVINRRKEIGIRKVLGASVASIVQSISFDFLKLVVIGFLIGAPLAYFLIQQWLNSFAFSTTPGIVVFAGSGIAIIGVALLTIGYQAIKAALANPVDSLKSE
ncbi:MAG: FtsX-like permease family protein [Balneola sp.]|nr:MAG: FtsX-like permease family protein [Balneola sp.]